MPDFRGEADRGSGCDDPRVDRRKDVTVPGVAGLAVSWLACAV